MANRILRDWTCSENIDLLSDSAEVFFTRLIMRADDFGCFHGNVKLLKSALYPLREIKDSEIQKRIDECVKAKIVTSYEIEGKKYLKINDFGQRLRTMNSKFPQPADIPLTIDREPLTSDRNPPPETKGNEVEDETEIEVEKPKKSKIPELSEFLNYAKTIEGFELKFESLKFSLTAKFEAWRDDGWKDGHGNAIKNWKSKLKNTIIHLKPTHGQGTSNNQYTPRTADDKLAEAKRRIRERHNPQNASEGMANFEDADYTDV